VLGQRAQDQARLLCQLVLVTFWVALVCCVSNMALLNPEEAMDFGLRSLPCFAFLLFCLLLAKSRWYLVGVITMTVGLTIAGLTALVASDDADVIQTMLLPGILGIIYAGALLPSWAVILTGLGAICNIALYATLFSSTNSTHMFSLGVGMTCVAGVLALRTQVYQSHSVDRLTHLNRQAVWLRALQQAFDSARVPLCRITSDGFVEQANPALGYLFGLPLVDCVDAPLEALVPTEEPTDHPIDLGHLVSGVESRIHAQRTYPHADGHEMVARVSIGVAQHQDGAKSFVASFEDVTAFTEALERREGARREAARIHRAKRQLLSVMSREIRSPLNGILGSAALFLEEKLLPAQAELVDIVLSSSRAMLEILDDAVSGQEDSRLKSREDGVEVDLVALVEEVCAIEAPKAFRRNVEIVSEIGEGVPGLVWADSANLRTVLASLIGAAVTRSERGIVLVDLQLRSMGPLRATLELSVRDTVGRYVGNFDAGFGESLGLRVPNVSRGDQAVLSDAAMLVSRMGGKLTHEGDTEEGIVVQMVFNWAIGGDARLRGSARSPLLGRKIWVALEPKEVSIAVSGMLSGFGAEAVEVGFQELVRAAADGDLHRMDVDSVLVDVGAITEDGRSVLRFLSSVCQAHLVVVGSPLQEGTVVSDAKRCSGHHLIKPVRVGELLQSLVLPMENEGLPLEVSTDLGRDKSASVPLDVPRILVVEDDPVHRRITVRMLERMGMYVESAANGRHALELFFGRGFDLILLDCVMPNMDGYEAVRRLRTIEGDAKRTPVIALTASVLEADRQRCFAAGMDGFLSKPFDLENLRDEVLSWLKQA